MRATALFNILLPLHPKKVVVMRTTFHKVAGLLLIAAPVLAAEPTQEGSASPTNAGLKPPLHGLEEVGYRDVDLEGGFWWPT